MEAEIIQRFLESVGQKADVDLYLKLFRAQRKDSFAILTANAQIVKTALDPVHFDLRILASLGLSPVVMLGLLEATKDVTTEARFRLLGRLTEALETRKVVFLGRRSDLEPPAGDPLSMVNLAADYERLVAPGALS